MADYREILPHVFKWEGGFVNHPNDRGGATNRGVTWTTYQDLAKELGLPGTWSHFSKMSKEDAAKFIKHYWDKATFNNSITSQKIAEFAFFWLWASGVLGLRKFQSTVKYFKPDVEIDGKIGKQTVKAANSINPDLLYQKNAAAMASWYKSIAANNPSQRVFLKGWLNRLQDFTARHTGAISIIPILFFAYILLR